MILRLHCCEQNISVCCLTPFWDFFQGIADPVVALALSEPKYDKENDLENSLVDFGDTGGGGTNIGKSEFYKEICQCWQSELIFTHIRNDGTFLKK